MAIIALIFNPDANFINGWILSHVTPDSAMIFKVAFFLLSENLTALAMSFSTVAELEGLPLTVILPFFIMVTDKSVGATTVELDCGNGIFICTMDEVSIKKISNRKMMSVNDDILN